MLTSFVARYGQRLKTIDGPPYSAQEVVEFEKMEEALKLDRYHLRIDVDL
jgi:hypothetical protein